MIFLGLLQYSLRNETWKEKKKGVIPNKFSLHEERRELDKPE